MTDMTVALRVLADTQGAEAGLKRLVEAMRDMGVGARTVEAAGVPLRALGPAGQQAATGLQRLIEAQTGVTRATEDAVAAGLRHGQMLDDLRARYSPLFAVSRQYEQELRDIAEAERLGALSATEAAMARDRAGAAMAPLANGITRVGQASGAAAAYTANLGFQLNDIAMMVAAGQNPLMLAMQQGTQVSQVFGQMQASGLSIGASLRTALMGMVSPLSLMTLGVIAGGAALVQWLGAGAEKAMTLDEAMEDLSGAMSDYERSAKDAGQSTEDLRKRFGAAGEDARALYRDLAELEASKALRASRTAFQTATGDASLMLGGAASGAGADLKTMSDLFGLDRKSASDRAAMFQVRDAMTRFSSASYDPDADTRLDRMAAAADALVNSTREAIDLDGQRTDAEEALLDTLVEQALALQRQKEIRAEIARTAVEIAQRGEDRATRATRPEPMSGSAFQASSAERADLDRQAAMAALVAQHGRDSYEVARARVEEERRLYELQLQGEAVSGAERLARLASWDAAKGMGAVDRERKTTLEAMLADLQQQGALQQAIATYGEDSAEVARLRADQEKAAFVAMLDTAGASGDLRDRLLEAWDNAEGLARANIAAGIDAAVASAANLVQKFGMALNLASAIAGLGMSENAPGLMDDERGSQRAAAADGREFVSARARAAAARRAATYQASLLPRQGGAGGGAGGGGARDGLSGLSAEAQKMLAELDIGAAAVAEKVRAGLISVAEGETEMASAKQRAAGRLAELIARLDQLGPVGKAAADAARAALADLAAEAGKTDQSIRDGMISSFEDSFVRSLATGKSAMSAFADHVKAELARAFTQKFITPLVTPLINGLMGMFTGIFSAKGNVIAAGNVVPFAQGGAPGLPGLGDYSNTVVNRATPFAMAGSQIGVMGEAGAEAILPMLTGAAGPGVRATAPDGSQTVLPLRRTPGGALGVMLPDMPDVGAVVRRPSFFAQGGVVGRLADAPRMGETAGAIGASRPPAQIIINNNNPTAKVTATERQGSDGMSMDIVIEQIEGALAGRARRGVGALSGVLGADFGLSRQGR